MSDALGRDGLLTLLRSLHQPITGETALVVACVVRWLGLDSPSQLGNAYFRCPGCGQARDLVEPELLDPRGIADVDLYCPHCDGPIDIEDLTISEGWVSTQL